VHLAALFEWESIERLIGAHEYQPGAAHELAIVNVPHEAMQRISIVLVSFPAVRTNRLELEVFAVDAVPDAKCLLFERGRESRDHFEILLESLAISKRDIHTSYERWRCKRERSSPDR